MGEQEKRNSERNKGYLARELGFEATDIERHLRLYEDVFRSYLPGRQKHMEYEEWYQRSGVDDYLGQEILADEQANKAVMLNFANRMAQRYGNRPA